AFGKLHSERIAQVHHFAIERDRLERTVCCVKDGDPGCLVHAARLHADESILDEIDTADAVFSSDLIQRVEQCYGIELLAVDRDRLSLYKRDLDYLRLGSSVFRRTCKLENIFRRGS